MSLNLLHKIGENKKKFSLISVGVIILLVLPLTLFLVNKNQENRSRASAEAKLLLSTKKLTLAQNESATIFVALDTGGNNVSAIDVTLKYDPASLQFDSYTADPNNLPEITHEHNIAVGTFHYVGANTDTKAKILGVKVPVFSLNFKSKVAGKISLTATNVLVSAIGQGAKPLQVTTPDLIATDAVSTPTPTPTLTPSSSPSQTPTPTPTPTSTPINMCTATKNRPESCACDNDNQCRSTLCSSGKCSPRPTQAVVPGHTGLNFSVALPGIAQKLNNNDDNPKPVNSSRIAGLQIYNSSNAPVLQGAGNLPVAGEKRSLVFNASTYKFEGAIDLGTAFTTGNYTLKLGLDNTLKKQLGGIITITQGLASNTSTSTLLVPGDINQDNSVDIQDYNIFIACYRNLPICTPDIRAFADLNDNGQIDANDEAILKRGFQVRNGD